jgi:hypothetical protein
MGEKPSPYQLVQGSSRAKEVIVGDHNDPSNVFMWDHIHVNLLGMLEYQPHKPWVSKWTKLGLITADYSTYVDDTRPSGATESQAWEASSTIAKKMSFLGLQDAARKWHPPLQVPGPWNGAMVESVLDGVFVVLAQDKWDKMKAEIRELGNKLTDFQRDAYDSWLPYVDLRSNTGSMGYSACTYPAFIPFLKGFYLTLDSLCKDQDAKGWPMKKARCAKKEEGCVTQVEADYADDLDDDDLDDAWEVQWLQMGDDLVNLPGAEAGMTPPVGDNNEYAPLRVPVSHVCLMMCITLWII